MDEDQGGAEKVSRAKERPKSSKFDPENHIYSKKFASRQLPGSLILTRDGKMPTKKQNLNHDLPATPESTETMKVSRSKSAREPRRSANQSRPQKTEQHSIQLTKLAASQMSSRPVTARLSLDVSENGRILADSEVNKPRDRSLNKK